MDLYGSLIGLDATAQPPTGGLPALGAHYISHDNVDWTNQLDDHSGAGNHLDQIFGAPFLDNATQLNGLSAMRHRGANGTPSGNDYFWRSSVAGLPVDREGRTVWALVNFDTGSDTQGGFGYGAAAGTRNFSVSVNAAGRIIKYGGTTSSTIAGSSGNAESTVAGAGWHILTVTRTDGGTGGGIWVDNVQVSTAGFDYRTINPDAIYAGVNRVENRFASCWWLEWGIGIVAYSDEQRLQMLNHLNDKYALGLTLP